ncbi:MAG: transposase [Acidimicrobiales bacterium]
MLAWFSTDVDFLGYLDWLRWTNGFTCLACGSGDGWLVSDGRLMCSACAKLVSATAGRCSTARARRSRSGSLSLGSSLPSKMGCRLSACNSRSGWACTRRRGRCCTGCAPRWSDLVGIGSSRRFVSSSSATRRHGHVASATPRLQARGAVIVQPRARQSWARQAEPGLR